MSDFLASWTSNLDLSACSDPLACFTLDFFHLGSHGMRHEAFSTSHELARVCVCAFFPNFLRMPRLFAWPSAVHRFDRGGRTEATHPGSDGCDEGDVGGRGVAGGRGDSVDQRPWFCGGCFFPI